VPTEKHAKASLSHFLLETFFAPFPAGFIFARKFHAHGINRRIKAHCFTGSQRYFKNGSCG
jgi:hypothetical protein